MYSLVNEFMELAENEKSLIVGPYAITRATIITFPFPVQRLGCNFYNTIANRCQPQSEWNNVSNSLEKKKNN